MSDRPARPTARPDPEPAALIELRRSLSRLVAAGASTNGDGADLEAVAERLALLRPRPSIDSEALWDRLQHDLVEPEP